MNTMNISPMNAVVYMLLIPIAVYAVARWIDARHHVNGSRALLVGACALFALSVIVPSPPIHGEQTEFFTHFFGGGVFMGLLWLYFRPRMGQKTRWYMELLYLYAATCALGVLNELYELFVHEIGLGRKPLTDTSWDLFANTAGMLLFYGCYRLIIWGKRLFFSR